MRCSGRFGKPDARYRSGSGCGTGTLGCAFATWAIVVEPLINPLERCEFAPTAHELAQLIAHDLRTPLNAVRGFSELLMSGTAGPIGGEVAEMLAEIERAGRALEDAISVAQELAEPCTVRPRGTSGTLRSALAEEGYGILSDTAGVACRPTIAVGAWRRLLGVCRDHLCDDCPMTSAPLARIRVQETGSAELVLSGGMDDAKKPASALRERLIRLLAARQGVALVSLPPHRPIRLQLCRDVL